MYGSQLETEDLFHMKQVVEIGTTEITACVTGTIRVRSCEIRLVFRISHID